MENQELLDYVLKNDLAKVVRHSFSVTQGEAEVIINGKSIVRYGDERWLQHKDGTFSNGFRTLQANEVDFFKEMIDGWGSILSDEKLIKSALEQFPEQVKNAIGPITETKLFTFKNNNGNVYDVLSYDSKNNVALLKLQGNEYNFVVAEGLNKKDWNYGHYFANEEAAHNYFVRIVSDTLDYKVKMKYLLEDEGLNLDGIDFDVLFEKFLNDDSKPGLIDTEYFEDLIEEVQNPELSYEMGTLNVNEYGKIMQDMLEVAKGSENHTWFLETDNFVDGTYTQEDLNELFQDIQSIKNKGITDIENIIEMMDSWQEAEEWNEPVATFHGAFLELFEEKERRYSLSFNDKLDYFPTQFEELIGKEIKMDSKVKYYVYNDLNAHQDNVKPEVYRFDNLQNAIDKFNELPTEWKSAIGCTLNEMSEIDLIHKVDGKATLITDYQSIPKYNDNKDVQNAIKQLKETFHLENEKEEKKGLAHIHSLGTSSKRNTNDITRNKEQER